MEVILLENIKALGKSGQKVDVAPGYARNYLVPRKMAVAATSENAAIFENNKKARTKKSEREKTGAADLAAKVQNASVSIARMAGDEDKLFGSVTNGDIAEALKEQGIIVDKRKIDLVQPIKSLGTHQVSVNLHSDVEALITVTVTKLGGIDPQNSGEEIQDANAPLMTDEDRAAAAAEAAERKAAREKAAEEAN